MLYAAILALVGLVVVLVTGRLPLGPDLVVRGMPARLLGLVALTPVPIMQALGFGVLRTIPELTLDLDDWRYRVIDISVLVAIIGLIAVLGYGIAKNQQVLRYWKQECGRLTGEYQHAQAAAVADGPAAKVPVTCLRCSATLRVPAALVGKSLRCPKCQAHVEVPPGLAAAAIGKPRPPVLPKRPRTRGLPWFVVCTLAAAFVIVGPTMFVAMDLAARLPRPSPQAQLDETKFEKVDEPVDDPPPVEEKKVDPPKVIEPEPKVDPPPPDPSKPRPVQVVVVPGRETPPWTAASFSEGLPNLPQTANLWISELDGTISHWSRSDGRKLDTFKADRPLAAMIATRAGIIGQYVDPAAKDAKDVKGAGSLLIWNVPFKKDAKTNPSLRTIPYKGSVSRFLVSRSVVYFLDPALNQVGELNAVAIRKTVPVKSPGVRAFDIAPSGQMFILCANNVVEVFDSGLAPKSKFELDGPTITDLAVANLQGRQFLLLIGKSPVYPTTCFAADLTDANLSRPLAVEPLAVSSPCQSACRLGFLGDRKITTVLLTPPPTRVDQSQTFDLPAAASPGRVVVSGDGRFLAIPGGSILGLE